MHGESGADVQLRSIHKTYANGFAALRGVDLTVRHGEWLVLVGPSGCGKTTTLRVIAGLEEIQDGAVEIAGQDVRAVPPWRRGVAMVFQRPALAPTYTVRDNLRMGALAAETANALAIADILGLTKLLDRLPHQLSGGQQQRVALGRALARRVPLYLLDEPLGQLDAPLRDELRRELQAWHQQHPATVISVTHDPREAWALGQRVAIMDQGRILQVGPPQDLHRQPSNRFVAAFFAQGPMNFFEVQLRNQADLLQWIASDWPDPIALGGTVAGTEATVGLRAEDVKIGSAAPLTMTVKLVERTPHGCWVSGDVHGRRLTGWSTEPVTNGVRVGITMDWTKAYVFDRVTGNTVHAPRG